MKRIHLTLLGALLGLAWLVPAQAAPVFVDAEWLEQRLDDPSIVLVDMATDQTQYQRFHIPGAVYLPFGALVQRQRNGVTLRVPDQRLFIHPCTQIRDAACSVIMRSSCALSQLQYSTSVG